MQLFSGIKDKFVEYLDTRLKLFQISVEEKVSGLAANMLYGVLLIGVAFTGFILLLILIAKLFNHLTGSPFIGYVFVIALCVCLLWVLVKPSSQQYITSFLEKKIISTIKNQHGNENTPNI